MSPQHRMKKVDALRSVRALAQHHPDTLTAKLHDVCVAVIEEVLKTFSTLSLCVSCCCRLSPCVYECASVTEV